MLADTERRTDWHDDTNRHFLRMRPKIEILKTTKMWQNMTVVFLSLHVIIIIIIIIIIIHTHTHRKVPRDRQMIIHNLQNMYTPGRSVIYPTGMP